MSYQLIHTSYPHLLDSAAAGYGTVARSEHLPVVLVRKLTSMSILKDPQGGPCTSGAQFSYRLLEHAGVVYHVLTCVQEAGADYTGRACHTAHHLILNQKEVAALLTHELRPTPAGIILALQKSRFWIQKWQGEPRYIIAEPQLNPSHLPDASTQPTWKYITGHKSNARAFYTAPYERECLVTVPMGTPSTEVLGLFHESDWLTHSRGWGMTFTTETEDSDSFASTLRMVVAPQSPLVQRALRTGHPVLHISAEMELPMEPPPSAAGNGAENTAPQIPQQRIVHTTSRTLSHYHYTEEPDWLNYDIPAPRKPYATAIALGIAGIISLTALGYYFHSSDSAIAGQDTLVQRVDDFGIRIDIPPVQRLSDLLASPWSHEETMQLARELSQLDSETQEDELIQECAGLLLTAHHHDRKHASELKRICECARLLGLKDTELATLYLREATHGISLHEWHQRFGKEEIEAWLQLKLSEPQLSALFEQNELHDYDPANAPVPPEEAPILATADTPLDDPETDTTAGEKVGQQSIVLNPAVSGERLPQVLAEAITRLPLSITTGSYLVTIMKKGDSMQAVQRLELSEHGYRLHISATDKKGTYRLKPEHKEGMPTTVPELTFSLKGDKIRNIKCGEHDAIVVFPVPISDNFHSNVILAPSFGIPIPLRRSCGLPAAADLNFEIKDSDLEISTEGGFARLNLRKKWKGKRFPWVLDEQYTEKTQFNITLPYLCGPNRISETQHASSPFIWQKAKVTSEDEKRTQLRCGVHRIPKLPWRLDSAFEDVVNAPCCGREGARNKSATVAQLYYIATALSQEKLTQKARRKLHDSYFKLLSNEMFNEEMSKVLVSAPTLLLSPKEADLGNNKAKQARRAVAEQLDTPHSQEKIRECVRFLIMRSLIAAYEREKLDFEAQGQQKTMLMLRRITQGEHGELLWHFLMQSSK